MCIRDSSGSAPPYHRPRLRLRLLDGLGNSAWSGEFAGDLSQAVPGAPLLLTQTFALPPGLPVGAYSLRASLVDRNGGRPDSILQSGPRDAQGRVVVASVSVVAGSSIFASGFE